METFQLKILQIFLSRGNIQ